LRCPMTFVIPAPTAKGISSMLPIVYWDSLEIEVGRKRRSGKGSAFFFFQISCESVDAPLIKRNWAAINTTHLRTK
jgi:hypothetical protein